MRYREGSGEEWDVRPLGVQALGQLCQWAGIFPQRLGEMIAQALRLPRPKPGERAWDPGPDERIGNLHISVSRFADRIAVHAWIDADDEDFEVDEEWPRLEFSRDEAAVYSDMLLEGATVVLEGRNVATALQQQGVEQEGTDGEDGAGDGT
jgi:hypothetical protein